jgi:2-oxoglutarate ferredoxin oxidoreductase subunit alpha
MVELRAAKVAGIARDIPLASVTGETHGDLLVVGWGSTFGAIVAAVRQARDEGHAVSHLHLRHLNPMPANVGELLRSFTQILVPENNLGQLAALLRSRYEVPVKTLSKVEGRPFLIREIRNAIEELLRK